MSTFTLPSTPLVAAAEPFGQTGIRQYLGSFLAIASAAMLAISSVMWLRSLTTGDVLDIYTADGRTRISSSYGRVRIAAMGATSDAGWNWAYRTQNLVPMTADPWQPSIWKTIGIEFRAGDAGRGSASWLRVKWSTAAAAFAIWPALHVARQMRAARKPRQGFEPILRYCGRCGRNIKPDESRCAHCGREMPQNRNRAR